MWSNLMVTQLVIVSPVASISSNRQLNVGDSNDLYSNSFLYYQGDFQVHVFQNFQNK